MNDLDVDFHCDNENEAMEGKETYNHMNSSKECYDEGIGRMDTYLETISTTLS